MEPYSCWCFLLGRGGVGAAAGVGDDFRAVILSFLKEKLEGEYAILFTGTLGGENVGFVILCRVIFCIFFFNKGNKKRKHWLRN